MGAGSWPRPPYASPSTLPARELTGRIERLADRHLERFADPDRLVELKVLLQRLLVRFPALRLAVAPEEIRYRENTSFYGVHELPVTWAAE
ncbi:hypothetical protein JBE27_13975 [Streptomyces albiflaviniger]|nr:hypothetical protein [Streptomyces albiflaviniger]